MATVLDVGTLDFFVPILVMIFVFVIFYAIFEKTKLFGDEKGIHALIAIIFAFLFVIVKPLRELITTLTPWFVVMFFMIFIVLMGIMIFGFKENDITKYLSANPGIVTTLVIIILIVFILGLKSVFPDSIGYPVNDDGEFGAFRAVLFNPKVMGFFLIFLIAYFVMRGVGFTKK